MIKIENILPQLTMLQKTSPKTDIRIYQGFKGVQTCFEHYQQVLKKGEGYYCYGMFPIQEEKYHLFWKRHHIHGYIQKKRHPHRIQRSVS